MLREEDIAIDLKCQQYICKSYIRTVVAFNDVLYLYSTGVMSERYAKALTDGSEAGEADF